MKQNQRTKEPRSKTLQENWPDHKLIADLAQRKRELLAGCVGEDSNFSAVEELVLALSNEVDRMILEQVLQETADELQHERLEIGGELYKRHTFGTAQYFSPCGRLSVGRYLYRRQGCRNGDSVDPVALKANLHAGATPTLADFLVSGYADDGSRRLERQLNSAGRVSPSRSSIERIATECAAEIKAVTPILEPTIREQETLPPSAVSLRVGLDRTSVPMEELRQEFEDPNSRRKARKRPYQRSPPEPVNVHYRMAYVGTVAIIDDAGDVVAKQFYSATPDEGPKQLIKSMMADIGRYLEQKPLLNLGIVQDGAGELWTLLRSALKKQYPERLVFEAVDIYHVRERLAALLPLLGFKNWLHTFQKWGDKLETEPEAASKLVKLLRTAFKAPGTKKKKLADKQISYFEKRIALMNYAELQRHRLLIGSGVTEGACKSIIQQRAKRSGQRWHQKSVGAVLNLRCIVQSDRWSDFWRLYNHVRTPEIIAA